MQSALVNEHVDRELWQANRRGFLRRSALSIGSLALATLLRRDGLAEGDSTEDKRASRGVVDPLHFPPA